MAGLRHPNIVQVHEAGDVDGRPYFTMEFVEGGSLAQKLTGTPQPASSCLSVGDGGRGRPGVRTSVASFTAISSRATSC